MHPSRGRIDLCLLSQKELKELHEAGCAYVDLVSGDPPCEKDLSATATPKKVNDKPTAGKNKKINNEPPPPPPTD